MGSHRDPLSIVTDHAHRRIRGGRARPNAVEGCRKCCRKIVVYTCCIPVYILHALSRAACRGLQLYSGLQSTALQRSTVYSSLHSPSDSYAPRGAVRAAGRRTHRRETERRDRICIGLSERRLSFGMFRLRPCSPGAIMVARSVPAVTADPL